MRSYTTTPRTATVHHCRVPGCGRPVHGLHLMCRAHWIILDETTRDNLALAASKQRRKPSRKHTTQLDRLLARAFRELPADPAPRPEPETTGWDGWEK